MANDHATIAPSSVVVIRMDLQNLRNALLAKPAQRTAMGSDYVQYARN